MKLYYKLMAVAAVALIPLFSRAGTMGLDGIRDRDDKPGKDLPGLKDNDDLGGTLPKGWERNGGPWWLHQRGDPTGDKHGRHGLPHGNDDGSSNGHGDHGVTLGTGWLDNDDGRDGTNKVPESAPTAILLGASIIALVALGNTRRQKTRTPNS